LDLLVTPLETSGVHMIELRPVATPIRVASAWVSAFFLALTLLLPLFAALRRSRAPASRSVS
jgi:hypothetical protein